MPFLKSASMVLLMAIVAALIAFSGLSASNADCARAMFYIFVVIFHILLVGSLVSDPRVVRES